MKRNRKPRKCSNCGSKRIANILYGMPGFSDELQRDIELGKIILGGCLIGEDDPDWQCADCGRSFQREIVKSD
jgi:DNA-directed RNA polymerase subunit RPC12/RpoP